MPPDPDLGQNVSFLFNLTANSSSAYTGLSPQTSKVISIIMIGGLTINMVSMGCTMEANKIMKNILKPKGVATAILSQYGVMPLTAFALSKAFQLEGMMTVAVLVCGCCPGGALSNILALALKGDMNLSIVMTSCSTLLALGMMPLLLYIYCQGFANVHKLVPYAQIVMSLALTLVPCGIGIVINHYRPKYANIFLKLGISVFVVCVTVIVLLLVMDLGNAFLTVLAPSLMVISFVMPFIGYSFGYIISSLFKLSHRKRRTVAMETGCQNIQLCSTILKVAFPPAEMGPLFMFPMIFLIFQLSEACVLIALFRCYQKFTGSKEKEPCQPAACENDVKEPLNKGKPEKDPKDHSFSEA